VADGRTRRFRLLPALAATVAAGIVSGVIAGCATVPSDNAPRQVLTGGNAAQAYVRPLPPPGPQSGLYKNPNEIVFGFLSASASYAFDPEAAMQFLTPALRKSWQPGPVTVVSSVENALRNSYRPGLGSVNALVQFKAQRLATLGLGDRYEYASGTRTYTFELKQQPSGVWLISGLPLGGHSLLLTEASFQAVYQARNLFFFARQAPSVVNGELIPDPVYAPEQSADSALNTDVAWGLIEGLLKDQDSWLSDATTTAFPPGTKLKKVTISGQVATVNLIGAAVGVSQVRKNQMAAQLLATLASNAYSTPLAHTVVLQLNGRTQRTFGPSNLVSPVSTGPVVYQSGLGTVNELHSAGPLMSDSAISPGQVTALAATDNSPASAAPAAGQSGGPPPVPAIAVTGPDGKGCTVDVPVATAPSGQGAQFRSYPLSSSGGPCTSLSWDRNGNLWAVAGAHIWLVRTQQGRVVSVSNPPNLPADGRSGPDIISLQMAPDGVRAALLIKTRVGNRVLLASVFNYTSKRLVSLGTAVPAWTGLKDPTALSWYSAYSLAVLTDTGILQVPLTGGTGRVLGNAPPGAISLGTNGRTLVVGTQQGAIETSSTGANSWKTVAYGSFPSYPT